MRQRDFSLDFLRIMACLMVIVTHSPMARDDANGLIYSSISFFTGPCNGLFFMVSGALILPPPQLILQGRALLPFHICGTA